MQLNFPYGGDVVWHKPSDKAAILSESLYDWLVERGSLTHKLKQQSSSFRVKLLHETLINTSSWGNATTQLWSREVLLILNDHPWVYARTLIPPIILSQQQSLVRLADKPLGELLFTGNQFTPDKLQITQFNASSQLALKAANIVHAKPTNMWARRRYFKTGTDHLIVGELFLPAALAAISAKSS